MKTSLPNLLVAAALAASATSASAQSLGAASNYEIFLLDSGVMELVDANQLFGDVGLSNNSLLDAKNKTSNFSGTIDKHTGATIKDGAGLNPSGGIQSSASIDATLNQANIDIANYVSYLAGLGSTASLGKVNTDFSYSSTMGQTVLDFTQIDLDQETFTLNGRAGFNDTFIIRVSSDFEMKESDLVLNNVANENLIWYYSGNNNFDLHKSNSDPNQFMKFAGTVVAPDGQVRLGEVDFTGKVYGSDLKLGSGFVFVPEPSSSLMLLIGAGGLLLRRRRSH